jgi:hypothetical protein
MHKHYQDGMALVQQKGRPSFFITMTCNPNWPEITNRLRPGETTWDRPDICDRVFHLKVQDLKRRIMTGRMFGKVEYYMHSIEFQKRGLPHVHLTFRVEGGGPRTPEDIDKVINAEIPPESDPTRELILKHLIHGPCALNRCLDQNTKKCSKNFPKPAEMITREDKRGYWHYRRRMKEKVELKKSSGRSRFIDDQWVVEHNKELLLIYNCHINVQIASTVHIIKYLFKYIYKGADYAKTGVTTEAVDEITDYQKNRYLSASESHWRFSEFHICEREPKVEALSFHLPNKDILIFEENYKESALNQKSQLTKYFERPRNTDLDKKGNPTNYNFDHLTYQEYHQEFLEYPTAVSDKNKPVVRHPTSNHYIRQRQERKNQGCVARLYWVKTNFFSLFL